MQHQRQRGFFLLHLLHVPRSKGAGSASCRGGVRRRPDQTRGSDPQTPGPARTLKLSSRRHRLPARPPTAPLLSGLPDAQAQCWRPRDAPPPTRAHSEHARACGPPVGQKKKKKKGPAPAHTRPARRPPPLPPPSEDLERTALKQPFLPSRHAASGTQGLHPPGCARGVNSAALPRHGIARGARRRLGFPAHNPRESPPPNPPRDRPLWRFHFLNWTAGHALGKHRPEFPESVGKSCLSIS